MNGAEQSDLGSSVVTAPQSQPSVSASVRTPSEVSTTAHTDLSRQNLV